MKKQCLPLPASWQTAQQKSAPFTLTVFILLTFFCLKMGYVPPVKKACMKLIHAVAFNVQLKAIHLFLDGCDMTKTEKINL